MSYFQAAVDLHREKFEPYRALIVLDDKTVRRYVLAWSPALVRLLNDWPLDDTLADLWECVKVDHDKLADLTGDPLPTVLSSLRRVQGLGLVYPDGSIPPAVVQVLSGGFTLPK